MPDTKGHNKAPDRPGDQADKLIWGAGIAGRSAVVSPVAPSDIAPDGAGPKAERFQKLIHPERAEAIIDRLRQPRRTETPSHRAGALATAPGSPGGSGIIQCRYRNPAIAACLAGRV
jgi:hypothetical protein